MQGGLFYRSRRDCLALMWCPCLRQVSVSFGPDGVPCNSLDWVSPSLVTCEVPTGLRVGPHNVTLSLEKQGRVQVRS